MTIESTTSKQTMNGNGSVRTFPFTFKAWEQQLRIVVTAPDKTETDVTAAAAITLSPTGGVVTYPASGTQPALPEGHKLTIVRDMDFKQGTDLVTGSRYLSDVLEERLDKLTAQDQQLKEKLDRALVVSVSSTEVPKSADQLYDDIGEMIGQGKAEVQAIADEAAGYVEEAKRQADRAGSLADPLALASQVYNVRRAWRAPADVAAGEILPLAGGYYPLRDVLNLTIGNVPCTRQRAQAG